MLLLLLLVLLLLVVVLVVVVVVVVTVGRERLVSLAGVIEGFRNWTHSYETSTRHGNWPRIRGFPLEKKCPPPKIKRSAQIRM